MTFLSDTPTEHTSDSFTDSQVVLAANTAILATPAPLEPAERAQAPAARERTPGQVAPQPSQTAKGAKTPPSVKSAKAMGGKPPKLPRYVTRRKPDNLLMYARRIPADILAAGIYPETQTAIRICFGTRDWLTAQPEANQLTAQLEALWAETRAGLPPPATPAQHDRRKLHADDIPVLTKRLVANLLHSDDLDRGECMGDAEYEEYEAELDEQRKRSVLSGQPIPASPLEVLAPIALTKLGVNVRAPRRNRDYNSGLTTQVPTGVVVNTGTRRITRKLGFNGRLVEYERG